MALVLTRHRGETIHMDTAAGESIDIKVDRIGDLKVRLVITASQSVQISRVDGLKTRSRKQDSTEATEQQ